MNINPLQVYSEKIQHNCSQSGHLTTFGPPVPRWGQGIHPSTNMCQEGRMNRPCVACVYVALCSASCVLPSEVWLAPLRRFHGRKADLQTNPAVWYNGCYVGGRNTAGDTEETTLISLGYSLEEVTLDLGLEGWRSSGEARWARYLRLSNGKERTKEKDRVRLRHHWYPKNCKVPRTS